ncbi:hypothetical protein BSF41_15370 [Flavobacterium sp. ACN2]|jgi:hypothetical protein|nr:hypothetical protein BSF41_15370 [Flavobacterium sp. ACN2]
MKLFWRINLFISILTLMLFMIPILSDLINIHINYLNVLSNLVYLLESYFEMVQVPISFL